MEQTREWGEAENIYPLTPMQKGMLFHSLFDLSSGAYFQQTMFDLHGDLDIDSFSKSLDGLSQNMIFSARILQRLERSASANHIQNEKIGFEFIDLREMKESQRRDDSGICQKR
ncbi:hypothetical protein KQR57_10600 [Bacillus inaquosorum]|nr:hypothetical protein [Bacillus inaquosorum]